MASLEDIFNRIGLLLDETGNTYSLGKDKATGVVVTIASPHNKIHDGDAYTTCKLFTHGAGDSPNLLIVTPSSRKLSHFVFQIISDDVLQVDLYEGADYAGGGALTAFNRYRDSNNTRSLTITSDATDTAGGKGTLIWTFKAGANKTVTNTESDRFEFILKRNTKYLLEAVGANGDLITYLLDWYEIIRKA